MTAWQPAIDDPDDPVPVAQQVKQHDRRDDQQRQQIEEDHFRGELVEPLWTDIKILTGSR